MKRRDFIRCITIGSGAGLISSTLASPIEQVSTQESTTESVFGSFTHGIASGDPTSKAMIIWTRFVPDALLGLNVVNVRWEMATDKKFTRNVKGGTAEADVAKDFTIKVDVTDLKPATRYYYRFSVAQIKTATGTAKTLPQRNARKVNLAVASCANHPAGYFNVYSEISKQHKHKKFDALLHLGDYIYEYGMGEYATEHAVELDRVPSPAHECVTLQDYRRRYAQYHSDPDLQALHAELPFICIWDDHEIADNTWKDGALNHQPDEGEFSARRSAATQAFFEWLPIRDNMVEQGEIYRSFNFGGLVHLMMLDTRVTGRTEQLDYANYNKNNPQLAYKQLQADLYAEHHHLLGEKQKNWIKQDLRNQDARWTVLGQQVLMTKMELPFNLLLALLGAKEAKQKKQAFDGNLIMDAARNPSYLKSPYNLDGWDGYPRDRDWIYSQMARYGKSLVSFAGDTHNAWAGELTNKYNNGCGIELAAASITSPGIDHYLPLPPFLMRELQKLFPELITDLKWANIVDRGFMAVSFDQDEVNCEWIFVNRILDKDYKVLPIVRASSEDAIELDIDEEDSQFEDWLDDLDD